MRFFSNEVLKRIIILILTGAAFPTFGRAASVSVGLIGGMRTLNDDYLKKVYGDGYVFIPNVQFMISKPFSAEVSYEGGYKKSAAIGIYKEWSTLKISGWEFSGIFHYPIKWLLPYIKFGAGYYFYKQDIESPFIRFKVDHHKGSLHLGSGAQAFFGENFFLRAEVKYVLLKVKPFDTRVDLGGLRYLLGLGFKIY